MGKWILTGKWILSILIILSSVVWSCGGKKLIDPGQGGDDEILFLNDTPENSYRITVVGTSVDFTLRAATEKSVQVPVLEDNPPFTINIERTKGTSGNARLSERARAGEIVRIFLEFNSFLGQDDAVIEVKARK